MKITVLQWNIWIHEKADNVLEQLQEIDADILCLQELTQDSEFNPGRDLPAEIAQLGYESFYQQTLAKPTFRQGNGIFSKFPITASRHVHVQKTSSGKDNYSNEDRLYLEAKLNINDHRLTVGTTHLSYSPGFTFSPAKEQEADKLVKAVKANDASFILTGDLNALPDSTTIAKLEKVLTPAGPDYTKPTWTTKPFEYKDFVAKDLNWRLDYVFTTPDIKVLYSKILKTDYSDHLPILVKIDLD